MVQLADGRRVGVTPDQKLVNELEGETYFYTVPNEEGGYAWLFYLPEKAFNVTVNGQEAGEVHVMLITPNGASGYGAQSIAQLETGTFEVNSEGYLGLLEFDNGQTAEPFKISEANLNESMGFEAGSQPAPQEAQEPEAPRSSEPATAGGGSLLFPLFCCCLCVLPVIFGGVGGVFVWQRRSAKAKVDQAEVSVVADQAEIETPDEA
jgi:hypothetical protein